MTQAWVENLVRGAVATSYLDVPEGLETGLLYCTRGEVRTNMPSSAWVWRVGQSINSIQLRHQPVLCETTQHDSLDFHSSRRS
jgi:hypothetical protein